MATLFVHRNNDYNNRLRKISIFLNDTCVGTVKSNESIKVGVNAGENKVYVKIDWVRSNILHFNSEENNSHTIEISSKNSRYFPIKSLILLVLAIFSPFIWEYSIYIKIAYFFCTALLLADLAVLIFSITNLKPGTYLKITLVDDKKRKMRKQ